MFGGGDLLGNSMPQQDAFGGFNSGQPEFPSFTAYEDESLIVGLKDEIQPDGAHLMTCVFKNKSQVLLTDIQFLVAAQKYMTMKM